MSHPKLIRQRIDFEYPCGSHNRGFLLPLSKLNSLISVDVHSSEFFIVVMVVDGDLPVTMLAAFVITEACSSARSLSGIVFPSHFVFLRESISLIGHPLRVLIDGY